MLCLRLILAAVILIEVFLTQVLVDGVLFVTVKLQNSTDLNSPLYSVLVGSRSYLTAAVSSAGDPGRLDIVDHKGSKSGVSCMLIIALLMGAFNILIKAMESYKLYWQVTCKLPLQKAGNSWFAINRKNSICVHN